MLAQKARNLLIVESQRSLARMQKAGNADMDPGNKKCVDAYLALRKCSHRITASALRDFMKARVKEIGQGARERVEFWGVPKTNFPSGLPTNVSNWEVSEDDLQEAEVAGGPQVTAHCTSSSIKVAGAPCWAGTSKSSNTTQRRLLVPPCQGA